MLTASIISGKNIELDIRNRIYEILNFLDASAELFRLFNGNLLIDNT